MKQSTGTIVLRVASGALSVAEISTALENLSAFERALIFLDVTTLTLPDADDEVDFFIQTTYDGGLNWIDVENVHFDNSDNGSAASRIISIDGARDGPGRILSILGTDPAPGAEVSETVPAATVWCPHAVRLELTTDANPANREVNLDFDDGAALYHTAASTFNHVASNLFRYNCAVAGAAQKPVQTRDMPILIPKLFLMGGHRIRTTTANKQAGDDYTAPQMLVEAWHDPRVPTDAAMGDHLKSYDRPLGSEIRIRTTIAGATAPTYAYSAMGLFA